MDPLLWRHLCDFAWLLFLAYWIYSAQKLKATKRRERGAEPAG